MPRENRKPFAIEAIDRDRFFARIYRTAECWLWTGASTSRGYGAVWIQGKVERAHRVAWMLMRGPIPPGTAVRHLCGVPPCANPNHLMLGRKGRAVRLMLDKSERVALIERARTLKRPGYRRGPENINSHLTTEAVQEIRRERRRGATYASLARKFGVTLNAVKAAYLGVTWRHVACDSRRAGSPPDGPGSGVGDAGEPR